MSEKQGWTPGPNGRGSFDIFWSCVSTLALCVWTAVHPNILRVPSSQRALLSRLGMMLVAIVFPELIISAAWSQLRSSRWLRWKINVWYEHTSSKHSKTIKKQYPGTAFEQEPEQALLPSFEFETVTRGPLLGSQTHSEAAGGLRGDNTLSSARREAESNEKASFWTYEQAFFAVMGGFAVENEFFDKMTGTRNTLRRLVTPHGVLQLAKMGLIPSITPDDIKERSKADVIAKMFVLSQITWFGLQVIGRLVSQIPVTPIEIHTVIHVACTIVIYLMWLEKPYDVHSSYMLDDERAKDFGALCNFHDISAELYAQAYAEYEKTRIAYWRDRVVRAAGNLLDHDPPPIPPSRELLSAAVERYSTLSSDETLANPIQNSSKEPILDALAPAAFRCIEDLRKHRGFSDDQLNTQSWDYFRDNSENFTMRQVWGGWSTDTGHEMSLDKGVHFVFNLLYGGGHLAAWASSSFPTAFEQWLWRGSAIMLTSVPLWGFLWVLWWKAASSKRKVLYPIRNGDLDIIAAPLFLVIILAYFLARSYLLIESIISLRLLPPGAFLTVNWTRYLPHIS